MTGSKWAMKLLLAMGWVVGRIQCTEQSCEMDLNGNCLHEQTRDSLSSSTCRDDHDQCLFWAVNGECTKNEPYMRNTCSRTCRFCLEDHCQDFIDSEKCELWGHKNDECHANPRYMLYHCPKTCEVCEYSHMQLEEEIERRVAKKEPQQQQQAGGTKEVYQAKQKQSTTPAKTEEEGDPTMTETPYGIKQTLTTKEAKEVYANMTKYMDEIVLKDAKYATVRKECKNRNANCAFWAATNECESNITRAYMVVQCAPTCQTCDHLDFDIRCPFNSDDPVSLKPGDLHRTFESIAKMKQYEPVILSQPSSEEKDDAPWIIQLDAFLSPEECDTMIELGAQQGYAASADVGNQKFDGSYDVKVYQGRTSRNAWCQNECLEHETTQSITARIESITGIPEPNHEFLQMLRYEEGQFYQIHHDYIAFHQKRKQGVRTFTVFLYLNDVEEGGETDFPKLGIAVAPKQGRALIWSSVKNADPNKKDPRTDHQALAVKKGIKYGANSWLHQRDFKEPHARACI